MASAVIGNQPANLSMSDFRAIIDGYGGLAKQCRYLARIIPVGTNNLLTTKLNYNYMFRDLSYLCDSTELPGRSFEVFETRYYGPNLALPYNTKYTQEISMSFMTRAEGYERQLFDDWLGVINPVNNFNFEYAENYYCRIDLYQFSEFPMTRSARLGKPTAPKVQYMWSLHNAWPSTVSPQPVTWADNDVLRLSVSFIYQYWTRPGRDATPGGSPTTIPGLEKNNLA